MCKLKIVENRDRRDKYFATLLRDVTKVGYPHQHELWPCVRRGVGQRVLDRLGVKFGTRRSVLYFMRGNSAEALITGPTKSLAIVHNGVIVRPDMWVGLPELPFREIKSTAYSSAKMWGIVKRGEIDLDRDEIPMRNYFEQCAIYCAATGVTQCGLDVYFLHGDYGDRRKLCSECKGAMGAWQEDGFWRECTQCGYKSYTQDLRTYDLYFTEAEVARMRAEVFTKRRDQFNDAFAAFDGATPAAALLAPPTFNGNCVTCEIGRLVGCENYGVKYVV